MQSLLSCSQMPSNTTVLNCDGSSALWTAASCTSSWWRTASYATALSLLRFQSETGGSLKSEIWAHVIARDSYIYPMLRIFSLSAAAGGCGVDGHSGSVWRPVHCEGLCHHLCPQHYDQLHTGDDLLRASLNQYFLDTVVKCANMFLSCLALQSLTEHPGGRPAAVAGQFGLVFGKSHQRF